jgi:hypothetical protein
MTRLIELSEGTHRGAIVAPRSRPLAEIHYVGEITAFGPAVFIRQDGIGRPLRLGEAAGGHGYTWGRTGLRAREVSRAILLDAAGNEMLAERLCRPFTWEVLSGLPPGGFQLRRQEVLAWVAGTDRRWARSRLLDTNS